MSPTDQERIATLEARQEGQKEQYADMKKELIGIKNALEKLPRRISRSTRKHIERCREQQAQSCAARPAINKQPEDYSWLRKLLAIGLSIGTLIGGVIYGFTQESAISKKPAIQQGVKP